MIIVKFMKALPLRVVTIFFSLSVLAILAPGCTTYVQSPAPPPAIVQQPVPVYVTTPPPPPQQEYIPPPPEPVPVQPVYVPAPAPEEVVVIHSESDFYEPLTPYGRWIDVDGYGRCW